MPGGTTVGVNAWVIHRNTEIFGKDIDVFRPERWLEAEGGQLEAMKKNLFSVSYVCNNQVPSAREAIGANNAL